MSQAVVSVLRVAVVGTVILVAGGQAMAQSRAEVLERIAPVGEVAVAGQAPASQPAPAPEAAPMAASEPSPAPAEAQPVAKADAAPAAQAEPAPIAAAPAAMDGSGLYVSRTCSACHGADANSPISPAYPKLAGQSAEYLVQQMNDIKTGARNHGQTILMKGAMAGVSEDEIKAIADWLSTL